MTSLTDTITAKPIHASVSGRIALLRYMPVIAAVAAATATGAVLIAAGVMLAG